MTSQDDEENVRVRRSIYSFGPFARADRLTTSDNLIRPHVNSSPDERSSLDKHRGDPDLGFSQRHWQLYPTLTLGAKLVDTIGTVAVASHAADEQKCVAV